MFLSTELCKTYEKCKNLAFDVQFFNFFFLFFSFFKTDEAIKKKLTKLPNVYKIVNKAMPETFTFTWLPNSS